MEKNVKLTPVWTFMFDVAVDVQDPLYFPLELCRKIRKQPNLAIEVQNEQRARIRTYVLGAVETSIAILGAQVYDIRCEERIGEDTGHALFTFKGEGAFGKASKCKRRCKTIEDELLKQVVRVSSLVEDREGVCLAFNQSSIDIKCFPMDKTRKTLIEEINQRDIDKMDKTYRLLKKDRLELSPKDVCLRYAAVDPLVTWEDITSLPVEFQVDQENYIVKCCRVRERSIFETSIITHKSSFLVACSERLKGRTGGIGKTNFSYWFLKELGYTYKQIYEASSTANTWDEYKTEPAVLLDDWGELGTRISNDEFKQLTDPHPKSKRGKYMPARYHNKAVIATMFAINTPLTVEEFVGKFNSAAQGGEGQIYRRLSHIFEFDTTPTPNLFAIYEYTYNQDEALTEGGCMLNRSAQPAAYSERIKGKEPKVTWVAQQVTNVPTEAIPLN